MFASNFDQESQFREFHFLLGYSAHIVIGKAEMSDGSGFKNKKWPQVGRNRLYTC
jgi:hypothetical protein